MALIILAVPLLLLWFMVSRGRKQQRDLVATQNALEPGTRVMTSSGLFAEVVEVEDESVVLEIAPGVLTRWNKRAIGQVLPAIDADAADPAAEPGAEPVGTEDVRSEAGYTAPREAEATEGSTGTIGTDGR